MQAMPWGLTLTQTLCIVGIAVVALAGLGILRFVFRLGGLFLRLGCVVLVVIAGIAFVMALLNYTNGVGR
ncbi:MAG TPA: hypothetical protein VMT34_11970 [Aggregatilineales bacterium]|nr:hypothetical protein [Aggregatilineales bacterium]